MAERTPTYTLDRGFVTGDHVKTSLAVPGAHTLPDGKTYAIYQASGKPTVAKVVPAEGEAPRAPATVPLFVDPRGVVVTYREGDPPHPPFVLFVDEIGHGVRRIAHLPDGSDATHNVGELVSRLPDLHHCTIPDELPHHPGNRHLHGDDYRGAGSWEAAHRAMSEKRRNAAAD